MRLIGRHKLQRLRLMEAAVEKWVHSWVSEVSNAHWRLPADVIAQFPSAHHQGGNCFLFPIQHCDLAIQLQIAFPQGIALISNLNSNGKPNGS